ncbi:MAG: hypothetical protein ABFD96_15400 [Armatimonadia bacterium]
MTTAELIGCVSGLYGAMLATVLAVLKCLEYRARVRVRIHDEARARFDILEAEQPAFSMVAANVGFRPVTLDSAYVVVGCGSRIEVMSNSPSVVVAPGLPCELTQGQALTILVKKKYIAGFTTGEDAPQVTARFGDATGKTYEAKSRVWLSPRSEEQEAVG